MIVNAVGTASFACTSHDANEGTVAFYVSVCTCECNLMEIDTCEEEVYESLVHGIVVWTCTLTPFGSSGSMVQ